jgi:hypothetical protein
MSRSTLWSVSFSILLQNFASFWIIPGDICTPAVVPVSDYDSVQSLCNKINHLFTYCSRCTVSQQTCSTYVFHVFKTALHSVARSAVCIWPHRAHGTGRLLWRHLGPIRLFISSKHRRFWNQHYKQHSHYKSSRYEHQHSNFVTSCLFSLSSLTSAYELPSSKTQPWCLSDTVYGVCELLLHFWEKWLSL